MKSAQFSKHNQSSQQGFTLIELLIVIAIIGILAAIVLSVLRPDLQQARAKDGVTVATMNKIYAEIQVTANTDLSGNGNYPTCSQLRSNLQNASAGATCGTGLSGNNSNTITITGVTSTSGVAIPFVYTWNNNVSPKVFCLSAAAQDTSAGAFIRLEPSNSLYTTPTRAASGC